MKQSEKYNKELDNIVMNIIQDITNLSILDMVYLFDTDIVVQTDSDYCFKEFVNNIVIIQNMYSGEEVSVDLMDLSINDLLFVLETIEK